MTAAASETIAEKVGVAFWDAAEAGSLFEPDAAEVEKEVARLRVRERARAQIRQEVDAAGWSLPDSRLTLAEELALPDPPVEWEIEGLHERGTNVLLAAGFKTGKTTLALNLMRSLMDGEPFLGQFAVGPRRGRVAWLNFELTEVQARRWLREVGVSRPEMGSVLNFRGHGLPLHSDVARDALVSWLREREVTYLVVDPFGSAYTGNENDNAEVRDWLLRLDEIKRLAGVDSLVLVVHTGRAQQEQGFERARGATKLDDWADIRWIYTKDASDAGSALRYFYASGRDVDQPEIGIAYDAETRRLRVDGAAGARGSGRGVSATMLQKVFEAVRDNPGLNRSQLAGVIGGTKSKTEPAIKKAIEDGMVVQSPGSKPNEKVHHLSGGWEWGTRAAAT